jgi:hypothetical protein
MVEREGSYRSQERCFRRCRAGTRSCGRFRGVPGRGVRRGHDLCRAAQGRKHRTPGWIQGVARGHGGADRIDPRARQAGAKTQAKRLGVIARVTVIQVFLALGLAGDASIPETGIPEEATAFGVGMVTVGSIFTGVSSLTNLLVNGGNGSALTLDRLNDIAMRQAHVPEFARDAVAAAMGNLEEEAGLTDADA